MSRIILIITLLFFQSSIMFSGNSKIHIKGLTEHQRKIHQDNAILAQFVAVVSTAKSNFVDGRLVKITYYDTLGMIVNISEYEEFLDSVNTTFLYQDNLPITIIKKASEDNYLTIEYTYDSLDRVLFINNYGTERKYIQCKYDNLNRIKEKVGFSIYPAKDNSEKDSNLIETDRINYKYDKDNNLIEEITYLNKKLISKTIYRYNKQNLIDEETSTYLGNRVKYKYFYNQNLLLREIIRYNINGTKTYFKVEYDYYK